MNDLATSLLSLLNDRARGRANAIPLPELSRELKESMREIQATKADLVKRGWAIGSSTGSRNGLFVVVDDEDRRVAARQILHRIRALADQLKCFDKSRWVLELQGQLSNLEQMDENLEPLGPLAPVSRSPYCKPTATLTKIAASAVKI